MTEYIVLAYSQHETHDGWSRIGPDEVRARSSKAAIQEALNSRSDVAQYEAFVAVPLRSWRPVTVKVETKTALKFT